MTAQARGLVLSVALLAAAPGTASAADTAITNAQQLAGLFVQSCVHFAGNRQGLRDWAASTHLQRLPAQGENTFLYGLPGMVFDASNADGKFVLISEDGGSCSAMAEAANGPAVVKDLEQLLRQAKINFDVTGEHDDKAEKALVHREYTASTGDQQWEMLVSTVQDPAGGEAMLTVNP